MDKIVENLIEHLVLERLEENLFRGPSQDIGTSRVYGGQVLGQAIKAAQYTVEDDRPIHSLHAYFLREGDHDNPIIYEVDRSRDGRSFSARRVVAIQHGRPIFTLSASFQVEEEGLEFQIPAPDVPGPDEVPSVRDFESIFPDKLPEKFQRLLRVSAPFDLKPIGMENAIRDNSFTPCSHYWLKTAAALPNEAQLHRAILAYVSDYGLLTTTLIPHGLRFPATNLVLASIDHAMWFHRPFRIDEWVLYSSEAISTSNARGLARGHFFNSDGQLIATTSQEGLLRKIS